MIHTTTSRSCSIQTLPLSAQPAASGRAVNGTQHSHTVCSHLTSLTTSLTNFSTLYHNKEHDTTLCGHRTNFSGARN